MVKQINSLAHQRGSNRGMRSSKSVRFRQLECDHAVRRAITSREVAEALLAEAQRDDVITSQYADELRNQLGGK